jgi:hypoxanthine-DNA glycosylase
METHPYKPFVPKCATKLILGSLPPWRFTVDDDQEVNKLKNLQDGDIDFYYGSRSNRFWMILSEVFKLKSPDTPDKIKMLLRNRKIAISDVVHRCRREPPRSALDQDLRNVEFNHGIKDILIKNPSIKTILFTSLFVEKLFHESFSAFAEKDNSNKGIILQDDGRRIKTVVLYSPSNMAIRGIRLNKEFKLRKSKDRHFTENDFRIERYRKFLCNKNFT